MCEIIPIRLELLAYAQPAYITLTTSRLYNYTTAPPQQNLLVERRQRQQQHKPRNSFLDGNSGSFTGSV